ncbi:SGNH/GDSL hydrolase family protein [Phycisphaera mikurensis]|uniref:SGNH hydrolase-type esterase domain-containing protein n=1 Tax=Phycisphaera mikurensis (strain NBRC 102666 / KCTC 22515 / FYK2301M01) TaxID=1142394 RepID=I0IG20_PHYMF|nr:GDSL-type esterase/lipase family protein [Phycisphaera mikurensis]MBB6440407.1 lysophospholipase L1-like esterase [Phycisphaera mikurensis]BAM04208.1 hypothetical protein PSMK_20490 [Phycisphaera mikurensis NBRC 102666]
MSEPLIRSGMTVLFQGDSITDTGRDRSIAEANQTEALGRGYALLASARLLAAFGPSGVRCLNRGVGGDKAFQLADRWQADCLGLKPDVLSLLIGVNDTWHGLAGGDGIPEATLPRFAHHVDFLLGSVREQNPEAVLVVCDPFAVPAGAGAELAFEPELGERRKILGKAAKKHDAVRVRFQEVLDQRLAAGVAAADLAADGVHPTLYGHAVMAAAWLGAVRL